MSPVHLRNQPEDRDDLSQTRRPGRGHLGQSGGWKDTEGNHTHFPVHFPKVQPSIPLGRTWSKLPEVLSQRDRLQRPYGNHQRLEFHQEGQTPGGEGRQDKGEASHYPSYRRTADPDRACLDSFRLPRSRPNQLNSGFTPLRNQDISGQESIFFTIPGSFQEKTRIQGQKKDHLQPEEERVRPNDPEAVGFGERSAQETEVAVNSSRIISTINRNITPTQIEHNVET
ncbi:hypothetical protein O181_050847 [Austropuccinia psidii MF-1]|uniref:Uncharacterized protein n=1 Tax=Austropuccinia psidii MF-1 TaxID=1389203 RepID=A0A9Q3DZS3_9BASI|nr:hypothetical protein [Austropuccinia psidii MF-1]